MPRGTGRSLVGIRFGYLIVTRECQSPDGDRAWVFRCDCGERRWASEQRLVSGAVISCGCRTDRPPQMTPRKSSEYGSWVAMRSRCYNPGDTSYYRYGGRGIRICDRWRFSFEQFLMDVGCRPSDELTLDRIDNDGPYSPENVRWATKQTQANNRNNNHRVPFRGETHTLAEWERLVGISQSELGRRIKAKWPVERALTQKTQGRPRRHPISPP